MRITLVADPHIAERPEDSYGVDTKTNLTRVIARLRELRPDRLVLMGDYSNKEPRKQDLEWICSRVSLSNVPFEAISGNHDYSPDVAEVCGLDLGLVGDKLYYRRDFGQYRALFLDSSSGSINDEQLEWLKMEMRSLSKPALVFMHHPPLEMGVPYMDEHYPLKDPDSAVFNTLFSGLVPVYVFCGHYHTARSTQIGPHSVHLCPSTYFQIKPEVEDFAVAHTMPGMRHIELIDGQVRTWIEFLPPAVKA